MISGVAKTTKTRMRRVSFRVSCVHRLTERGNEKSEGDEHLGRFFDESLSDDSEKIANDITCIATNENPADTIE